MPTARRVLLAAALAAALLTTGCGGIDEASAQGLARNDLVSELAAQLSGSAALTYTADYQLARGRTATVVQAQNPPRTAYRYAGGQVLVTTDGVTRCSGTAKPTCTVTTPPAAGSPLPPDVFAGAEHTGMVVPATVLDLLSAAALDTEVSTEPRDTTIAGHHATCLDLTGVDRAASRDFSACVTSDGVLGSFRGTVGGAAFDLAMTEFSADADPAAFTLPAAARITDRRPTHTD